MAANLGENAAVHRGGGRRVTRDRTRRQSADWLEALRFSLSRRQISIRRRRADGDHATGALRPLPSSVAACLSESGRLHSGQRPSRPAAGGSGSSRRRGSEEPVRRSSQDVGGVVDVVAEVLLGERRDALTERPIAAADTGGSFQRDGTQCQCKRPGLTIVNHEAQLTQALRPNGRPALDRATAPGRLE